MAKKKSMDPDTEYMPELDSTATDTDIVVLYGFDMQIYNTNSHFLF